MIWYLIYITLFWLTYIFCMSQGPQIISAQISTGYTKWRRFNALVSRPNRSTCKVLWYTIRFAARLLYLSFLQYMNTSVIHLGTRKYLVRYVVGGKYYCMEVKPKRGPAPILQVIDENDKDVTDTVLPYMGPDYQWHGLDYDFGKVFSSRLTFNLSNGNSISCLSSEGVRKEMYK